MSWSPFLLRPICPDWSITSKSPFRETLVSLICLYVLLKGMMCFLTTSRSLWGSTGQFEGLISPFIWSASDVLCFRSSVLLKPHLQPHYFSDTGFCEDSPLVQCSIRLLQLFPWVHGASVDLTVKLWAYVFERAIVPKRSPLGVDAHAALIPLHEVDVTQLLHVAGVRPCSCNRSGLWQHSSEHCWRRG